jgi:hypothetical protein
MWLLDFAADSGRIRDWASIVGAAQSGSIWGAKGERHCDFASTIVGDKLVS